MGKCLLIVVALFGLALLAGCGSTTPSITMVSVTCTPYVIMSGGTSQCSAIVSGSGSYSQAVIWSSNQGSISSSGQFTAPMVIYQQRPVITATAKQDGSKIGAYQLTVNPIGPSISSVSVSCSPVNLQSAQTSQCSAQVTGTGAFDTSVTWTVSSGSISSSGLLTAPIVPTNSQITAMATSVEDGSKSAFTTLNVSPTGTISSVTVNCALPTIQSNQDSQCTATVNGTGNFSPAVTWAASPGTVTPSGLYLAPTVSASTPVPVTATSVQNPGQSGSATLTVNPVAPGNNVVPVTVDAGPTNSYVNGAFASATICVPGTATCQTIDHLLVDTGSSGVRLLASGAAGGELSLSLPQKLATDGNPLNECFPLADGFVWGPVVQADVQLGGEQSSNLAVQVIGQTGEPAIPSSCSNGTTDLSTLAALGANGILGLGLFSQDCGTACTQAPTNVYYSCPAGAACNAITLTGTSQVLNPVPFLPGDNNGVLLQLPSVTPPGATTVSGSLILGIGTQSNNGVGSAAAYTTDSNGNFMVQYTSTTYPGSIDSGLNANYFLDSTTLPQLPTCTGNFSQYYCPSSTQSVSVTNVGINNASSSITFSVDNASDLFTNNPTFAVFPTLAGPSKAVPLRFDWGLPFFFGRNVFTAIDKSNTPLGPGPFWAY
ncbi:MAG: DUF3443 family protein [Candidatus Korobacteraceae bacterium]